MTIEEMKKISDWINKQKGCPYPMSNQNVLCGFVTTDYNKWLDFLNVHNNEILKLKKREVYLQNGEHWVYVNPINHCRGFRFYKAKIDKDIDYDTIQVCILPQMAYYCCEIEWV